MTLLFVPLQSVLTTTSLTEAVVHNVLRTADLWEVALTTATAFPIIQPWMVVQQQMRKCVSVEQTILWMVSVNVCSAQLTVKEPLCHQQTVACVKPTDGLLVEWLQPLVLLAVMVSEVASPHCNSNGWSVKGRGAAFPTLYRIQAI